MNYCQQTDQNNATEDINTLLTRRHQGRSSLH